MELLDLHNLTQEERNIILSVIRRDDELRRRQDNRISQVKQEIHGLRMKSVLRSGDDLSKMCARCKSPFGFMTNTGDVCPACHFRVCKSCRENLLSKGWLCSLCFKENQLRWLSGEWMGKETMKNRPSGFTSGTDLLRASLRIKRPNGRVNSDFPDYDFKSTSGPDEKTSITKGNLGGPDGPPGPGGNRADRMGQDTRCPPDSPEKTPLSNLFHSIRSGLGGGSEDQESPVAGAMGGGGPGGGVVVQHVSCRRRHDSNSSSNSDSEPKVDQRGPRVKKQQHPKSNGTAVEVRDSVGDQHRGRSRQDNALERRAGDVDSRGSSLSYTTGSDANASVISVKERHRRHEGEGETGTSDAKTRGRRSELPQPVRAKDSQQRKESWVSRSAARQSTVEEERPASGCSFTSSEWGEVTPTESSPGFSAPPTQDRKEDMGSTPGQSSGYMSTSRKSLEVLDSTTANHNTNNSSSPQHNHDSPSPSKSKTSPSKLPVRRQESRDSTHREEPAKTQPADRPSLPQGPPRGKTDTKQGHVRRQSSGRSETLSTCSAKTASPATKMRLLDLASSRALDRDEEDSVQSWSGGSEDTMSLGMSCSGLPVSADTPVFQKMHPKRHKGCEEDQGGNDDGRRVDKSAHVRKAENKENVIITVDRIPSGSDNAADLSDSQQVVSPPSQTTIARSPGSTPMAASCPSAQLPLDSSADLQDAASVSKSRTVWGKLKMLPSSGSKPAVYDDKRDDKSSEDAQNIQKQSKKNKASHLEDRKNQPWTEVEDDNWLSEEQEGSHHQIPKCTTAKKRKASGTTADTLGIILENSELDVHESATSSRGREERKKSWSITQQEQDHLPLPQNSESCRQGEGHTEAGDLLKRNEMQQNVAAAATQKDKDHRYSPKLNQHRNTATDGAGSDYSSDTGHGSPMRGKPGAGLGLTPQRSNLSIPSVAAASFSGSNDERSVEDDDDIDELFAKYRSCNSLAVSRSTIGDSRESLASVYSDAGECNYGRIPVSGDITFGLEFDPKLSALRIHLKGCSNLAPVKVKRNCSDPYVKVYLLPDKTRSGKQKSKIKKHTLNPVFNETLTYNISQGELENRTLWVTVWHNDRLGRNDFLGEVTIPMDTYRFGEPTPCTYTLQPRAPDTVNEEAMQYKGDLVISLKYVTPDNVTDGKKSKSKSKSKKSKAPSGSLGEIHAMIRSAFNLTAARSNGMSDPFVKGYLLPDRGKTSKQKTPVVKNSVNPMWNHILIFDGVDAMEIAERCLELTIWDHESLGTNEFLGGARLNLGLGSAKGVPVEWMDARGPESIVWQNMMERPNGWIDVKLPLRASMGKVNTRK